MTTYTHPDVLGRGVQEGWADPETDPTRIDWAARQGDAWIPFRVVDGRPVNPCEDTGITQGRNQLGHWGEGKAADALITVTVEIRRWWILRYRLRYVVLVERDDDLGWAVPGGMVEPGETAEQAAIREAREETDCDLSYTPSREGPPRYVPDPRASNEAWIATTPIQFLADEMIPLSGGDDARRAEWVRADTYKVLKRDVRRRFGGRVFAAHVAMLQDLLATQPNRGDVTR